MQPRVRWSPGSQSTIGGPGELGVPFSTRTTIRVFGGAANVMHREVRQLGANRHSMGIGPLSR
jgi:hypothetical protein